jgi:hypothetical protein
MRGCALRTFELFADAESRLDLEALAKAPRSVRV